LDQTFDLAAKPLTRALIAFAVRSANLAGTANADPPRTHLELLEAGVTGTAADITNTALALLGRGGTFSSSVLPEDAPIIIGFSLLIMLGITQAVNKEGLALETNTLSERLVARHLARKYAAAGDNEGAKQGLLAVSRTATLILGQIVETAQGEVEELFRRCYAALPGFIQGDDEARRQLMPLFGSALLLLLEAQIRTND
jgi:hypothetical protein